MLMGQVRAELLLRSIEPAVRAQFSEEQELAIREAVRRGDWDHHPVDLRLSLPSPVGRFYATLIAGRERRNPVRRRSDRGRFPLATLGNIAFFASGTLLVGLALIGVFALIFGLPAAA